MERPRLICFVQPKTVLPVIINCCRSNGLIEGDFIYFSNLAKANDLTTTVKSLMTYVQLCIFVHRLLPNVSLAEIAF